LIKVFFGTCSNIFFSMGLDQYFYSLSISGKEYFGHFRKQYKLHGVMCEIRGVSKEEEQYGEIVRELDISILNSLENQKFNIIDIEECDDFIRVLNECKIRIPTCDILYASTW
tara:strand:+ start:247 stop:585 length:339 start_codon:yes stop_codon:yes gene_type:complete